MLNEPEKLSEKHQKFEDAVRSESSRLGAFGTTSRPRNLDAFLPEGRVQVPLNKPEIKLDGKKEVAFVDTLALQTKLGVRNRVGEQSMSARDSEIVKTRNILSATPFMMMGGGTAALVDERPRMGGIKGSVLNPQGTPVVVDLAGMDKEKVREAERKFWESPERQSPLPPASQVPPAECAVPERPLQPVAEVAIVVPLPQEPTSARLVNGPPLPKPEDEPRMPAASKPIVVEPISTPVIVRPVIDQSDRIEELEAENAVLLQIVSRLMVENKALKAKK